MTELGGRKKWAGGRALERLSTSHIG